MSHTAFTRPERSSAAKSDALVQLAAAYRIFDRLGWSELIYNHLSLRVPGEAQRFLINPFGLNYSEVTASNLVTVDVDGNILGPSDWPIPVPVLEACVRDALNFNPRYGAGEDGFAAMQRLVDRKDPGDWA